MKNFRLALLALCMAGLGAGVAWAELRYAAAIDVQGNPQVQQEDGSWRTLGPGIQLQEGDRVRTGGADTVVLAIIDGNRKIGQFKVRENSEIVLQKMSVDPATGRQSAILALALGNVLLYVQALDDDSTFEVKTPVSISGVRGTSFEVQYDRRSRSSQTSVYEGTVAVRHLHSESGEPVGESVDTQRGERSRVDSQTGVESPSRMSDQEMVQALKEVERLRFSPSEAVQRVERRAMVLMKGDASGRGRGNDALQKLGRYALSGGLVLLGFWMFMGALQTRSPVSFLLGLGMIAGGVWLSYSGHLNWSEFPELAQRAWGELKSRLTDLTR
ncbi:MAG: FecR domain-containing protein [Candidatus Omnitrophica bacterium]|nr:FecR domain-containing protein [Candidatus Omnitrophota bacterium]